jgi:hypothetical protein
MNRSQKQLGVVATSMSPLRNGPINAIAVSTRYRVWRKNRVARTNGHYWTYIRDAAQLPTSDQSDLSSSDDSLSSSDLSSTTPSGMRHP